MPGTPPICDPACQKVILNSSNIAALVNVTRKRMKAASRLGSLKAADIACDEINKICDLAEAAVSAVTSGENPANLSASEKTMIIKSLNYHENEVCRAQAMFLKAVGYSGPVGKMLA